MCNVVAPTSSSTLTTPTSSITSSTPTPTPEILFPLWSSTKYGSVSSTAIWLFVYMFNGLTGAWAHYRYKSKHVKNSNNSFVEMFR